MVLSLFNLSLVAVRDGIEDGRIRRLDLLPPRFLQPVLDMVLKHGTVNEPTCMDTLMSPEFIEELLKIDSTLDLCQETVVIDFETFNWNMDHLDINREYWERLSQTLATKVADSNGQNEDTTIGDRVKRLRINIYPDESKEPADDQHLHHLPLIEDLPLIKLCRRLSALHIHLIYYRGHNTFMYLFDNYERTRQILENIKEFTFYYSCFDIEDGSVYEGFSLPKPHPRIEFKNLTSLSMNQTMADLSDEQGWLRLMDASRDTLQHLTIVDYVDECESILPFPLQQLRTLTIELCDGSWSRHFLEKLKLCPKLETLSLTMDVETTERECWQLLNELEINLELNVVVCIENDKDAAIVTMIMASFREQIRSCEVTISHNQYSSLWRRFFEECCNNVSCLALSIDDGVDNRCLMPLFENRARAANLRKLTVWNGSGIEYSMWGLIFDNCLNLTNVVFESCSQLFDEHLIGWASRGGARPSVCFWQSSDNITENGLIPILISGGMEMEVFEFYSSSSDEKWTNQLCDVLASHCPNIKFIHGIPSDMKDLLAEKLYRGDACFNKFELFFPRANRFSGIN